METPSLNKLLAKVAEDAETLALMLFGSRARFDAADASDVDLCLVLRPQAACDASQKRLDYLKLGDFDLHVFQQLPLYIRRRVLKEGKVLFVRDEDALYDLAFRTAQEFEDFKHHYYDYLKEIADAGS